MIGLRISKKTMTTC